MDTIGQRLRWSRERLGISQLDVAAKLDITNMSISNYEHDRREPDISTLIKFAEFYKVNMGWLTTGTGDPTLGKQQKDIYDILQRDDCTYRNVQLTDADKQRLRDFMAGVLWDRMGK